MAHEEQGFLEAIGREPEDDTTRLVYADWLTDRGEELRAELIRLQCERAALDPVLESERCFALEEREREILTAHEQQWVGDYPECVVDWEMERGLVRTVYCRLPADPQQLGLFLRSHSVRRLCIEGEVDEPYSGVSRLCEMEWPESLQELELVLQLTLGYAPAYLPQDQEEVSALLVHDCLRHLRRLTIQASLPQETLYSFFRKPPPQLESLTLRCTSIQDEDLIVLDGSPLGDRIRILDLDRTHLSWGFLSLLAPERAGQWVSFGSGASVSSLDLSRMEDCHRLESLGIRLDGNAIRIPELPSLRRLALFSDYYGRIEDVGQALQHLATSPLLGQLEELDLTHLYWSGALALGSETYGDVLSQILQGLSRPALRLVMGSQGEGEVGWIRIKGWQHLQALSLEPLHEPPQWDAKALEHFFSEADLRFLQELSIGSEHLGLVLGCPALSGLRGLQIAGGDHPFLEELRAIVSSPLLSGLRSLELAGVTQNGLRCLSEWPGLRGLQRLSLRSIDSCSWQTGDLEPLARSPYLSPLTKIELTFQGLSSPGPLAERCPRGRVVLHPYFVEIPF